MFTILTSIATEIRNRLHKLTAAEMLTVNHRIEEGRFKRQDAGRFTTESTTLEEATVEGNIALAKQVVRKRPRIIYCECQRALSNSSNVLVRAYPGLCRPRDGVENPLVIAIKAYTTISERDLNIDTRLFREPLDSKNLNPLALIEVISEELALVPIHELLENLFMEL
ncbi:hypothetical protein Tco_0076740, partial [Tanacetum coccineum]